MKNPIPVCMYVKMPQSFEDLMTIVESGYSKKEQELVMIGTALAFNLSNKIVSETFNLSSNLTKEEV